MGGRQPRLGHKAPRTLAPCFESKRVTMDPSVPFMALLTKELLYSPRRLSFCLAAPFTQVGTSSQSNAVMNRENMRV